MTSRPLRLISADALIAEITRRSASVARPYVVAVDGRSGAGKSTLAARLVLELDAALIESDQFYAGGSDGDWARTPVADRIDRVIDWRRLRSEALEPLASGQDASWRSFDFAAGVGLEEHEITRPSADIVLLEGAYSSRTEYADLLDLTVLVELPDDLARRARLIAREGPAFMAAWHPLWDDPETVYFSEMRPPESFDIVLSPRPVQDPA